MNLAQHLTLHQPILGGILWHCRCGATGVEDGPTHPQHQAQTFGMKQEWAATCDEWNGGRLVRATRAEAEADAAKERDREPHWSEPPPVQNMRVETRYVTPWDRAQQPEAVNRG